MNCINRNDLDGEPWMEELLEALDDEDTTVSQQIAMAVNNGICPSEMHGSFLSALRLLPKGSVDLDAFNNQYTTRMQEVNDSDPSNWVAEMIQNSRDVNATNIEVFCTDATLTLGHNGKEFEPDELRALLGISMSTKSGDVSTIGKFGIGFKYWYNHFNRLTVVVWHEGVKHSLSLTREFRSLDSVYCYEDDTNHDSRTEFRFEEPLNPNDWNDFIHGGTNRVLGDRVGDSLPFMQTDDNPLSISVESNGNRSDYTCTIVDDLSTVDLTLHRVAYGHNQNPEEALRTRMTLSDLSALEPNAIANLKDLVADEYRDSPTVIKLASKQSRAIDEIAEEKAEEAFESTCITLLLTPDKDTGTLSSLFIASEAEITAAFIADAPWKLTDTRHNVSWDYSNGNHRWNKQVAILVNRVYSEVMKVIIEDDQNFDLSTSEMYELLNRPLGEGDTSCDSYCRPHNFNHLSLSFNLDDDLYHCSEALCWLWKTLVSAGHADARRWLEEAMHNNLARVDIANDSTCPIRHSKYVPLLELCETPNPNYPRGDDELPEICMSLGAGIPAEIIAHTDDIRNNNPPDAPDLQDVLVLFDDVVTDSNHRSSFLREVEPTIVGNMPDWASNNGLLLIDLLGPLEAALGNRQAHFMDLDNNLVGHTRKFAAPLEFGEVVQSIAREGYVASADPALLPRLSVFLNRLLNNRPDDLSWGRAVLASQTAEETPLLVLLPPQGHVVAIAMGGAQSHSLSLRSSTLLNDRRVIIDFDNPPEVLHWGSGIDSDTVYIRTAEIPQAENTRRPVNGTWNWSDFEMDLPEPKTGWVWPMVTFEHLEDLHSLDALSRSTPVFIDAFHPDTNSGHGVHAGQRRRDNNGVITTENEPLHGYTARLDRTVDCMSGNQGVPMAIMSAAVSLEGDRVERYRTVGNAAAPIPNFEENPPHIHGVFRVLGILSKLVEDQPAIVTVDSQTLQSQHLYSYWKSKLSEFGSYEISRQYYAYDVMWVRGQQHTRLGLSAQYIPWPGFVGSATYIGDDDEPRFRDSDCFLNLEDSGLVGFQEPRLDRPYENHPNLFPRGHCWLPKFDNRAPNDVTRDNFLPWADIDSLRIHSPDDIRSILSATQQINAQNRLRTGIDRLLEVIFNPNNPTNIDDGLNWLEELLSHGLPEAGWLDARLTGQQQRNRTLLRELLETLNAQNQYQRIWAAIQTVNLQDAWLEFQQAAFVGPTRQQILDNHPDARIPVLSESGDSWISDFNNGQSILNVADDNLGQVYVMLSSSDHFPRTLFDIENGIDIHIVNHSRILDALELVCGANNEIVRVDPFMTLEGEVIRDNPQPSTHTKITYVNEMLREILYRGAQIEINWYPYVDREILNNSHPLIPRDSCIALEWEDRGTDPPAIHISDINPDVTPGFVEHCFIAKWLQSYLGMKNFDPAAVSEAVERRQIVSPWWFTIPFGPNPDDRRVEFNRKYCWGQLPIQVLMQQLAGLNTIDELVEALERLEVLYQTNNDQLLNSNALLLGLYENIPSIIPSIRITSFDPQNAVGVRRHISIPQNMLNSVTPNLNFVDDENLRSLGSYLVASSMESDSFSGYASNFDPSDKIAIDFSVDVRHLLYEAIFDQWFTARDDFILVEGIFTLNNGDHEDGKLHKYHALHILAFLYAKLGV